MVLAAVSEVAFPPALSAAIVGVFFGLLAGLFYYKFYYRNYFWWISIAGGLLFTLVSQKIFSPASPTDATLTQTIASFLLPFLLTIALNQVLYFMKRSKKKKHASRRTHSHLFDVPPVSDKASTK